jgi:hypothetical protein
LTFVKDPWRVSLPFIAINETLISLILHLSLWYCYATLFSPSYSLPLSSLLSLFFIGVALEELVAISCYNFFHLDNKKKCFGGFWEDLQVFVFLQTYEVKSF